jgi:hypothetical protein
METNSKAGETFTGFPYASIVAFMQRAVWLASRTVRKRHFCRTSGCRQPFALSSEQRLWLGFWQVSICFEYSLAELLEETCFLAMST